MIPMGGGGGGWGMGWGRMMRRDPNELEGVKFSFAVVRRVWRFATAYRRLLTIFLFMIVAGALAGLIPPLLMRGIIDHAIVGGDRGLVTAYALGMIGLALVTSFLSLLERWSSARIGEGVIFDLRVALFDHVQRMPIGFFTRTQTGALISRLNSDVMGAQRALTGTLGSVVSNVITLISTLIAMTFLEWRLTVLGMVLLPLFLLPSKRVGKRLQSITRESMELNAGMHTTMTERFGVAGALLVKLFGRHQDEYDEFSQRAGRVRDIGVRSALYMQTFGLSLGLIGSVGTAIVYLIGGQLVVSQAITTGTLVALGAYLARLYAPLMGLTNARVDVMTALVSFERVFEILDAPNPLQDRDGAVDLVDPKGKIELDQIWFRYPAAAEVSLASLELSPSGMPLSETPPDFVLRGVSAVVEPGQLVALVGPSGAGKTTISMLVPRIYDVTEGALRVDGHDVRELTQESLRAAIGVVAQDPHLFHDSVMTNLRYARPGATDAEVEKACRGAQIHDVIAALPDGYNTVVGERGYRLSGGEKQRLAIARMLLKDPAIVILDEATSHLDSENEAAIQEALAAALSGRTSIVIAHRLSTITAADQILVVDEGRIVERGTHHQLLAVNGLYAELYRTLVRSGLDQIAG